MIYQSGIKHRKTAREPRWKRSERQYKGEHWKGVAEGGDQITINMSFSTHNTIVPYVTGAEPDFMVEPYEGDATTAKARLVAAWLNRTWRSSRVEGNSHLERVVADFLIYGDGYMKQSYEIVDREIEGEEVDVAELWVDRINPWDVWIDPASDGVHNARWVAHRLFIPRSVLIEDPRYKNTAELSSTTNWEARDTGREAEALAVETNDRGDQLVEVIEFYDKMREQLIVFAEGSDMPLRVVEKIECPLIQLGNYIIPNNPYHMGEMEQLWELQMELNKTRSQMITHRKRNVQKYIAQEGGLTQNAQAALQSSEVGEIVWVKGSTDPKTVIVPMQVAQLSPDAYSVSDIITRDIYEISGVNEYLRGATPAISRTATEATIIESASNVKSQHKLRQVESFVRRVGQYLIEMAAAVFPETSSSEITMVLTGREAQSVVASQAQAGLLDEDVSPENVIDTEMQMGDDIWMDSRYEVFVRQYSTELRNPVLKEQKYREMFSLLLQALPVMQQSGIQPPNLLKVLELWLEAAGIDDIDAVLQPSEGQEQQMQQMQQMLQAQAGGEPGGVEPQAGAPSPQSIGAPGQPPSPQNSGMLGPEQTQA
jgi:hypothetical protein